MDCAVLIVEDEPVSRIGYEVIVTEAGYSIAGSAGTAVGALRAAQATPPDVALIDIELGSPVDGLWLARELAGAFSTWIVFLTGSDEERVLGAASLLRPSALLRKPALPLQIIAALQEAAKARASAHPHRIREL